MFTVKTFLASSTINGIGSMAAEFVPKGKIIWEFYENFDMRLSDSQYALLPEIAKEFVNHFGYYNKKEGGYILCMDNARYTNHSDNPNMQMFDESKSIAIRDIFPGEEITEDYFYFDEMATVKFAKNQQRSSI